jgi:hypothetical protein
MSEQSAHTENSLIRHEQATPVHTGSPAPILFDADARNRFEFDVREGVELYETAHVFEPISDERYMQWLREFKMRGNENDLDEESREATCRLWDDLIVAVEKINVPEGRDFRELIPPPEKLEAISAFMAVAIGADIKKNEGGRNFAEDATQVVVTEAWVNGEVAMQRHELKKVSVEWQKKYSRIKAKTFKQEKIGGLRRQPKTEYVPQDHRFGELYDEMFVSQDGFIGGKIPLRFKTVVIDHLFGERLSQKKSGS